MTGKSRMGDVPHTNAGPVASAEQFCTDHLVQDLGKRAISGGLVTTAAQGAKFFLNLASAVVLARLLGPEEFGLVGMVLAVTGLLGLFNEAGLSTATVQRETITQEQVSNLFWINVALSGCVCLVSMALAPLVRWFYQDSRLTAIMIVVSFTFLLAGLTVQHQALLTRQMRFTALAVIEVVSILLGLSTACFMALFGHAYWSLVGQQLCQVGIALVLTWWASGWRPTMPSRQSGIGPLVNFGVHLTASNLVARAAAASDSILVGRFFGAESLGLYSRAFVLLARPLEQLLAPIGSVLVPVLSRLQSDPERYRRTFLRAYNLLAMMSFAIAALCLVLAEPMVLVVFGPRWKAVVPLFAGFSLLAAYTPLAIAASWLFMSQGRGRDLLRTYSILSLITVAGVVFGLKWGPLGVVLALAFARLLVSLPILYHLAGRHGAVRTMDIWKGFLSHIPIWGAVYAATALARALLGEAAPMVQLLVCVPCGFVAGAGIVLVMPRTRESALYSWSAIRESLTSRFSRAEGRHGEEL